MISKDRTQISFLFSFFAFFLKKPFFAFAFITSFGPLSFIVSFGSPHSKIVCTFHDNYGSYFLPTIYFLLHQRKLQGNIYTTSLSVRNCSIFWLRSGVFQTGGDTSILGMHRKMRSVVHVPQSYHIEINAMVQYWSLDSACHLRGIKLSSRGV